MTAPALICDRCETTKDVHVREWKDSAFPRRRNKAKLCPECWEIVAGLAACERRDKEGRP